MLFDLLVMLRALVRNTTEQYFYVVMFVFVCLFCFVWCRSIAVKLFFTDKLINSSVT